jgi:hypothetical protein
VRRYAPGEQPSGHLGAEQPRRSIAAAIQMGGETGRSAVSLLWQDNRYGAAALVRQLVEIEYLLCLFTIDDNEPLRWALDSGRPR